MLQSSAVQNSFIPKIIHVRTLSHRGTPPNVNKNLNPFPPNQSFTRLIKARPKALQQNLQKQPSAMSQAQRASAKNRRLALQMENRPAVRAALGLKQVSRGEEEVGGR